MKVDNKSCLELLQQTNTEKEQTAGGFFSTNKTGNVSLTEKGNVHRTDKTEQSAKAGKVESSYTLNRNLTAYAKPEKQTIAEEISDEMSGAQSALSKHNEMAVASNTMSEEDYEKMREDGFSAEDMDGHTIVTVVDKIKLELASSGVDISDMGGELSEEVIKEATGSEFLAGQIEAALQNADLPLTKENTKGIETACALAESIRPISENTMLYMVSNELEPTISNLYQAQSASSANQTIKELDQKEKEALSDQIVVVIQTAGLENNDLTRNISSTLLANDVSLTPAHLQAAVSLSEMTIPMETETVISAAVQAISEGKKPEEAGLASESEGSLPDRAAEATRTIAEASEEDLAYLVLNEKEITIENLKEAKQYRGEKSAQTADAGNTNVGIVKETQQTQENVVNKLSGKNTTTGNGEGETAQNNETSSSLQNLPEDFDIRLLTAKRQLEEVRLAMTTEAGYRLLKQGVNIDTKSMEELVDCLKEAETQYYKAVLTAEGAEGTTEEISLFQNTLEKAKELETMPAYAIAIPKADAQTLNNFYQAGSELKLAFEQAGDSYETMRVQQSTYNDATRTQAGAYSEALRMQADERYETMRTQVRTDLGDSMQKAFGNVSEILTDLSLPDTEFNQRAVRILGYNNMEISEESIAQVKAVDSEVQRTFQNLTPATVAKLIKEQKNPLDMQLSDLNQTIQELQTDANTESENYSEFLWKLENQNALSADERDSYIGIYRMLHQIEKTDGAAVGALLNQGLEPTMRNLFTEVRGGKKRGMDYRVDDSFGGVSAAEGNNSITEQAEKVFLTNTLKSATAELSPEKLRQTLNHANWEDQTLENFASALVQADDASEQKAYVKSQLEQFSQLAHSEEQVYEMLEKYNLPATCGNLQAAGAYLSDRNGAYRKLFGMQKETLWTEDGEVNFDAVKEDLLQQFADALETPEDMAKAQKTLADVAENVMRTMINDSENLTSVDIKELQLMNKQISLGLALAKEETYHIPVMVENEVGDMTLKIVRGTDKKGLVNIALSLPSLGEMAAQLKAENQKVSGYIATSRRETASFLEGRLGAWEENLTEQEELQEADLHVVLEENLNLNHFESNLESTTKNDAGSEEKNAAGSGTVTAEEHETSGGTEGKTGNMAGNSRVMTKTLYHIAKSFLNLLNE